MKTLFFTLTTLAVFGLAGCDHPHIEGEVFISTNGGENVKLGRVDVSAFKPDEIAAAVKGVDQRFSPITGKLEAWKTLSATRLDAAKDAVYQAITGHRDYGELENAENAATDDDSEADSALDYAKGAEKYFDALPQPICSTKTDSEGKYELDLPSAEPVVLAAHATRLVGEGAEQYFWMVRLDPSKATKYTFSNDNQTTSGASESIVWTGDETGDLESVEKALNRANEVAAGEKQDSTKAAQAAKSPESTPQALTESGQVPDESNSQATPSPETNPPLTVDQWKKKAMEQYPDLAVAGSPLNAAFVAKFKAYQGTSYFDAPDWPMRLAKECAESVQGP